jgi:hypothetical protein
VPASYVGQSRVSIQAHGPVVHINCIRPCTGPFAVPGKQSVDPEQTPQIGVCVQLAQVPACAAQYATAFGQ